MVSMDSDSEVEITAYEKPFDERTPIGLSSDDDDDDVIVSKFNDNSASNEESVISYLPAAYRVAQDSEGAEHTNGDEKSHKRYLLFFIIIYIYILFIFNDIYIYILFIFNDIYYLYLMIYIIYNY